jgi:hypothetical protein
MSMKKLLGAVVGVAALMASGIANAAPVDIIYYTDAASNGANANQLTLRVDAGISVGYVSLAFEGATSFVPAPGAQISTADSVLDVTGGFAIIVSPFNVAMVPGGGQNSIGTLLFSGPVGPNSIREDVDNLGDAVLDIAGVTVASSIQIVPEPSTLALLGLGLAGLALVRRTA